MRRGFLLLETLLSFSILALLALAAFPALSRAVGGMGFLERKFLLDEESFFVCDYMTDKIRHTRERTKNTATAAGKNYPILAYNENSVLKRYIFYVEDKKWKLLLYTGVSQPLSGDNSKEPELSVEEAADYFSVYPGGLTRISYTMRDRLSRKTRAAETAVLPLYDYYLVGEIYE